MRAARWREWEKSIARMGEFAHGRLPFELLLPGLGQRESRPARGSSLCHRQNW